MGLYVYTGNDKELKKAVESIETMTDKMDFISQFADYTDTEKRKASMNSILKDVKCSQCGGSIRYNDGPIKGKYIRHNGNSSMVCEKKAKKNTLVSNEDSGLVVGSANAISTGYTNDEKNGLEKHYINTLTYWLKIKV